MYILTNVKVLVSNKKYNDGIRKLATRDSQKNYTKERHACNKSHSSDVVSRNKRHTQYLHLERSTSQCKARTTVRPVQAVVSPSRLYFGFEVVPHIELNRF